MASSERWLRGKELELLAHLYAHMGVTFTRPELLEAVWNCCPNLLTRTVDQIVATLRLKDRNRSPAPTVSPHHLWSRLLSEREQRNKMKIIQNSSRSVG